MAAKASPRKPRVLIHSDRSERFLGAIEARFPGIAPAVCETYAALGETLARLRPEVVLSHKFESRPYPVKQLPAAQSVRWIHIGGTGTDHLMPWDPARVTVTNSAGATAPAMAEYVLGAIYAINLKFPVHIRHQLDRRWEMGTIRKTAGDTIAVIGLGRIGRAICRSARAAGLRVVGVRRSADPVDEVDEQFTADRLHEALRQSDYVAVAVPRSPETIGLLDAAAFGAVKPGAILVNISRGGVVDEGAVLEGLESGALRAAVLDVFEQEPLPADSPFWARPDVIVTPHVAGFVEGWESGVLDLFLQNLERWLNGTELLNVVDPLKGY